MSPLVLPIVGLAIIGIIVFLALRYTPILCTHCFKKVTLFRLLNDQQRSQIQDYIRNHEDRSVDDSAVFACLHCQHVFDDFSGEKKNREADHAMACLCKICGLIIMNCHPSNPNIKCNRCACAYEWQVDPDSGFTFLIRQGDKKVLDNPNDIFGNA